MNRSIEHAAPTAGTPADVAIPALFHTHGDRVYALALRILGKPADAEDAVQDAFMQAYRKWYTFRGEANPGTWLYTIAARVCKARLRKRAARNMPALSQLMPFHDRSMLSTSAGTPDFADTRGQGPLSASITREVADVVQEAVLKLPAHFRVPLVMKEMLELPIEDVAAALNIKPETVKTRLHRARLALRRAVLDRTSVPRVAAPAPTYERQVCLDLLAAKLEAMDKGRGFPIGQNVVCDRCRGVFAELDLAQSACAQLADGAMPASTRAAIVRAIGTRSLPQ